MSPGLPCPSCQNIVSHFLTTITLTAGLPEEWNGDGRLAEVIRCGNTSCLGLVWVKWIHRRGFITEGELAAICRSSRMDSIRPQELELARQARAPEQPKLSGMDRAAGEREEA